MVRKLRHLLGQTDIRILVFLVCAVMLAGLALSLAQLEQNFSGDDFPTVSSWDDLVKHYLDFRERNYELGRFAEVTAVSWGEHGDDESAGNRPTVQL